MRIGSNISGTNLSVLSSLSDAYSTLASISVQLSTAKSITKASNNSSGLVAAARLSSQVASTDQAIRNVNYASYAMDTADAGLTQTSKLLSSIRSDVVAAASGTLSSSEKAALQTKVDNALKQIDSIGSNTNFAGEKVLNGSTLTFQISTDLSQSVSIQTPDISTTSLGGDSGTLSDLKTGGTANLTSGDLDQALAIIDEAEQQVLNSAATNASFQMTTLNTASATLESTRTALSSALSAVQDTNMAQAMSSMIKNQILTQTFMTVMKTTLSTQGSLLSLLS